jgi:plasmid stabilization system protein ParE
MTYRVIIEPTADQGIRHAYRWMTENRSQAAATKWFNALEKAIQTLETRPRRCPIAAENDKFPEEIRELLHGRRRQKYRIIFTIREDAVHVLNVRHGAQDEIEPGTDQ